MLKPSADLIIDPKQSRYSLVVGVAKRARQIVEEAEKNGQILVEKPVDLAVHDFMDNKYRIVEIPAEEAEKQDGEESPAQDDAETDASQPGEEPQE